MELKGEAMMEGVRMAMGALDCPICHEPLVPPIYQCGTGHLLCRSCRFIKLCPSPMCASPMTAFTRCFGMERVVEAIEVPCCFAKNGCTEKMAYMKRAKHEKACQHGPCFCPEPRCGFTGTSAALRGHFTGPPQVAVHGVQVLRAVLRASPAGPARAPCSGRQQRLPRERGASVRGTPRARHLPRLRPAGYLHRLEEVQVRFVFDVLVLQGPPPALDAGRREELVPG